MTNINLFHYPISPYSEKVRAMLGYANVSWGSIVTKEMPPRPELVPLAGDYKRIPVLQIDSDVFCDSNLAAEEIALMSNKEELSFEQSSQQQQEYIRRVEGELFFAGVVVANNRTLQKKMFGQMGIWDLTRFVWDRLNMARKSSSPIPRGKEAKKIFLAHVIETEERLVDDFLFGSTPTLADFAAYHPLWLVRDWGEKKFLTEFVRINAWMNRIKDFGHGEEQKITAVEAYEHANISKTRAIPNLYRSSLHIDQAVVITPNDYRQVQTEGILVGDFPNKWVISKENQSTEIVHIHFPKNDFQLRSKNL
jgi:glutathione S-transferase